MSPPSLAYTAPPHWQGRLAIRVASAPPQALSAGFSLEGTAQTGTLTLTSVLGTRLATMRWSPESATLQTPRELLEFASVDAMVTHSTGASFPLGALFGWLQGDPDSPRGWAVDLRDLPSGRIRAWRLAAEAAGDAAAEIKIILEPS